MVRRYMLNENYFSEISSENNSYLLGLLMADGTNYFGTKYRIQLGIQVRDVELLEIFKLYTNYSGPIKYKEKENRVVLNLNSKLLSTDLYNLGMTNNKSFTLQFPKNIPNNLIHHFIRGYSDGDGYIRSTNNNSSEWSIISSYSFCKDLQTTLLDNYKILSYIKDRGKVNELGVYGSFNVEKILDILYKDAKVYLNRKHERYLQVKEHNKKSKIKFAKQITDKEKVLDNINSSTNIVELAKELNIHYSTLYRWIKKKNKILNI